MGNIFISHSSVDNEYARKVADYLEQIGHQSIFLDFDPNYGIPAGHDWEKELYVNLRRCQVVIVLYSQAFSSSRWCFAETTHAKALGKFIIPLKINDCIIDSTDARLQVIDATNNREEAFKRLENSLLAAGINKEGWDNTRPPYPGLLAFGEEDAPIFFGREEETEYLLKSARQFRSFGGAKLLLVLGSSGSGKSSLIKAGVIPKLRKDKRSWLILGPLRPSKKPFEELSKSIANGFSQFKDNRNWRDIYHSLKVDSANPEETAKSLAIQIAGVLELSKEPGITILLFIDQLEELLFNANTAGNELKDENLKGLFLSALRILMDSGDNKLLVVGTLRSDFLGNFNENQILKGLPFDDYILKSVKPEGLRASITEPAKVAGIELEEGLVDTMLKDTGTPDALPLLAFTLRELWEQYGQDGLLEIEEYRHKLGGLEGSVARVAEAILVSYVAEAKKGKIIKGENNENNAVLDAKDDKLLKAAFMAMVRIDEEGRYTKRIPQWEELPTSIVTLIQKFVNARLLVISGDGKDVKIEVAHEALFRNWKRLINWLNDDKSFLLWRKRLSMNLGEWESRGRNDSELLRGSALAEAVQWLNQHKSGKYNLVKNEIFLIESSVKEAEKQRLKKRRNSRYLLAGLLVVLIIISFLLLNVYRNNLETRKQLAGNYWSNSKNALAENNFLDAIHFTSEAINTSRDENLKQNLLIDLGAPQAVILSNILVHNGNINSGVFSRDGKLIFTTTDSTLQIWDAVTGGLVVAGSIQQAAFQRPVLSPDEEKMLTIDRETARIWDVKTRKPVGIPMIHKNKITTAIFSPDGKYILTADWNKNAILWDAATGKQVGAEMKPGRDTLLVGLTKQEASLKAAFAFFDHSIDESRWFEALKDGSSEIDLDFDDILSDSFMAAMMEGFASNFLPLLAVFSPDGKKILTARFDGSARLWDVATGKLLTEMKHAALFNFVSNAAFSPDGKKILTESIDSTARIWDAITGKQVGAAMKHKTFYFANGVFSPDGNQVLTTNGNAAQLWDANTGKPLGTPIQIADAPEFPINQLKSVVSLVENIMMTAIFSPDGKKILTTCNGVASLWEAGTGKQIGESMKNEGSSSLLTNLIVSAIFSPDGKYVLTSRGNVARLWDASTGKAAGPAMIHDYGDRSTPAVVEASFSPDGKHILTFGSDRAVRLWEIQDEKITNTGMKNNGIVTGVVFSPDGKKILAVSKEGTPHFWDPGSKKEIDSGAKMAGAINSAIYSGDGKQVLFATRDHIELWDAGKNELIEGSQLPSAFHNAHKYSPVKAIFSPDGENILTIDSDSAIRIWESGKAFQDYNQDSALIIFRNSHVVNDAMFSPDGKQLVTAGKDGSVRIYNILRHLFRKNSLSQTGTVITQEGEVTTAVFSPDGNLILTAGNNGKAYLWDAASGEQVGPAMKHEGAISNAIFSVDGNRVLTAGSDGTARLWDAASGRPIGQIMKHAHAINTSAISPDGKQILTTCEDSSIHIWNIGADLDIPAELFRLQAKVTTGARLNIETSETEAIPGFDWHKLKEEYNIKAKEHFKTCKYPESNLWARINSNEARQIQKR